MADIVDQANDLEHLNIQHALANRPAPIPFTGKCRNCDEPISAGHYCDKNCRDDFEKRMRRENYYG